MPRHGVGEPMKIITIRLPKKIIEYIDILVKKEIANDRSEFIRKAIRNQLLKYANMINQALES